MATQYSGENMRTELAALITRVTGGKLKLYKEAIPLDSGLAIADLDAVECDFDGYAEITIPAALQLYNDGADTWSVQFPTLQFNFVLAGGTENDVIGAYVEDAAGALVQTFEFPEPISMNDNLDSIPIDLKFSKTANTIN